MKRCNKTGMSYYCTNKDIKRVQMRREVIGARSDRLYEGTIVYMCKECRKSNLGMFKVLPNEP